MKHARGTLRFVEVRIAAQVDEPQRKGAPPQIALVFEPTAVEYLPVFQLFSVTKNPDRPAT